MSSHTTSSQKLPFQVDLENAIVTFIFAGAVECAFLIAPFYFARRAFHGMQDQRRRVLDALGFRRFDAAQAFSWIILFFMLLIGVNVLYQFAITALHLNLQTNDQRILIESKSAPLTTYATLIASVVVAPFCEELFFRSFVFMGLLRSMSLYAAIIFSALIFAVAHADVGSFIVLLIIGILLAFLRWRTHSIWPCICLHLLNNLLGALQIVLILQGKV
jgi:membrane protease YdiL (CAAX protease family)